MIFNDEDRLCFIEAIALKSRKEFRNFLSFFITSLDVSITLKHESAIKCLVSVCDVCSSDNSFKLFHFLRKLLRRLDPIFLVVLNVSQLEFSLTSLLALI